MIMSGNPRILFFLKLPPPQTGATTINSYVFESELLERSFECRRLGVSYAKSVSDLGSLNLGKLWIFFSTFFRFLYNLIFHRPKLIYFQPSIFEFPYLRDLTFILIGRLFRVKFLLHLHGKGISEVATKSKFKLFLYKLGFSRQFIIVLSNIQIKDIALSNPKLVYIVPNGIQCISGINLTKEASTFSPFRFLFLSNLIKSKGILNLLEASKILKSQGRDFIIDIVGGNGDITKEEIEAIINQMGLSSCIFLHGAIYGKEKFKYYESANAFVYPTTNDALPLVILEAMQFGIPVIATKEGAIPEIIDDGITGLLVDKNRPDQIASKLEILMNDFGLRKRMGEAGRRKFSEKYTFEIFEQNMKNVFDSVLKTY